MSKPYLPQAWFWLADDGRVYGSAANTVVGKSDAAYKTFTSDGTNATVWPKDDAGAQTLDAMQAVVGYLGLAVPGSSTPAAPVITYKADIYRRCTDAEAEAIEVALAAASVRQRRLFEESQFLNHNDEAFATMQTAMVGMFGKDRAAVLLAAS